MKIRLLVPLELVTAGAGLAGGLLLALAPDGSLLHADPGVLAGTPFTNWRWPGVLLAVLVGGGFLAAGCWQWRRGWRARELSMTAGAGLVLFEAVEVAWIGFQPLQVVFTLVGLAIIVLGYQTRSNGPSGRRPFLVFREVTQRENRKYRRPGLTECRRWWYAAAARRS